MAELNQQQIKEYIEERSLYQRSIPLSDMQIKENNHGLYIGRDAKLTIDGKNQNHPYSRLSNYSNDYNALYKKLQQLKRLENELRKEKGLHPDEPFHAKDGYADQIHSFPIKPTQLLHDKDQGYFYGKTIEIDGQEKILKQETEMHPTKEAAIKEMAIRDVDNIIERANISLERSDLEPIDQPLEWQPLYPEPEPVYAPEPEQTLERAADNEPEHSYENYGDPEPEYEYGFNDIEFEPERDYELKYGEPPEQSYEDLQNEHERAYAPKSEQTRERADDDEHEPDHKSLSSSIGEPKHEREDEHEPSDFINDLEKEHEQAIEDLYDIYEMRIDVVSIER